MLFIVLFIKVTTDPFLLAVLFLQAVGTSPFIKDPVYVMKKAMARPSREGSELE